MGTTLRESLGYVPVELGFGTSGLRGRVVDLSQLEVVINTLGFLRFLRERGVLTAGDTVCLAGDLRPSTTSAVDLEGLARGEMMQAVAWAVGKAGCRGDYLGLIPSPALMAYALRRGQASVMVTGSHIPFDRNGIKFNKPDGEVLKSDEGDILRHVGVVRAELMSERAAASSFGADGRLKPEARGVLPEPNPLGGEEYLERYVRAFPEGVLRGKRLLVYQHSAVGRDLLVDLLKRLGVELVVAGRSEEFIPVDTEAVQPAMLESIQRLVDGHGAQGIDAVVSTDGDSDRPLLLGVEEGRVRFFGGDLLGLVVADYLGAQHVAVPVSANDAVERFFGAKGVSVTKTRIGSPHVIAAMRDVGWEANGGFLTARALRVPGGGELGPLPTRDAFLPLLGVLHASLGRGLSVVECFGRLPGRYGRADVMRDFPREISLRMLEVFLPGAKAIEEAWERAGQWEVRVWGEQGRRLATGTEAEDLRVRQAALQRTFGGVFRDGRINWINVCDGCRFGTERGEILHLRPSGNAPEQRVYAVADSQDRAVELVDEAVRSGGVIARMREELEQREAK
jgi:phosphomannomutase